MDILRYIRDILRAFAAIKGQNNSRVLKKSKIQSAISGGLS